MLLKIPFYENKFEGNQCMQVAMQSVLKHFLGKEYSVEELDRLTGRKKGFWTFTAQIVPALYEFGLDVRYYSKIDLEPFLEGKPFFRKQYGKDAEKILKFTDLQAVTESIKKLLKYNVFEKRKLDLKEIENHIQEGYVPMVLLDHNIIYGKKDFFQGHFVVVTGFDEKNVFFHESGPKNPEQNKKVPKKVFKKAWNANCTDNDVVIVFGKK